MINLRRVKLVSHLAGCLLAEKHMNYLTHAYKHLHDPYFVAGTSLPDWMSVIDRRNRARSKSAALVADHADPRVAAFARGVVQHHHDDRWFHQTQHFGLLCSQFAMELRELVDDDSGHQAGFVGHIVIELLLDSVLTETDPLYLQGYYSAIESLDLQVVQNAANLICSKPVDTLAILIPRFTQERFLADYSDDGRLCRRLNQVMRRVSLPQLPETVISWIGTARIRVHHAAHELLTEPEFIQPAS
jgi:hypothetical protein